MKRHVHVLQTLKIGLAGFLSLVLTGAMPIGMAYAQTSDSVDSTETTSAAAVTPHVEFIDPCGTQDDTFTLTKIPGVTYLLNGMPITEAPAGLTGDVSVQAQFDESVSFAEGTDTEWSTTFSDALCEEAQGPANTVALATTQSETNDNECEGMESFTMSGGDRHCSLPPEVTVDSFCKKAGDNSVIVTVIANTPEMLPNAGEETYTVKINGATKTVTLDDGEFEMFEFENLPEGTYDVVITWGDGQTKTLENAAVVKKCKVTGGHGGGYYEPEVTTKVVPCIPDSGKTDSLEVTVVNPYENKYAEVEYEVTVDGQVRVITLNPEASDTLTFTDLPAGELKVMVEGDDGSWVKEYVTIKQCGAVNGVTDVCPNIPGSQETVPEGMIKNQEGNCVEVGGRGAGPAEVLPASTTVLADTGEGSGPLVNLIVGLTVLLLALGTSLLVRKQHA